MLLLKCRVPRIELDGQQWVTIIQVRRMQSWRGTLGTTRADGQEEWAAGRGTANAQQQRRAGQREGLLGRVGATTH